ncbi:MAG: hypothetical protein U0X91_23435 [Spirosomataceae bacterium]
MEEKKTKYSFKAILEKYVSEILVIFLGISMSFLFDEWRQNRSDEETAKKHLAFLRTNLVQDTLLLTRMIDLGHKMVRSSHKLAYFQQDSDITDSLSLHIDNAASYLTFKPNQMAYEEIKQTAHTNLIKNDSLKTLFLSYYTSVIPSCTEWCKVDETHTMTQLIPEMSLYFPVVIDSLHLVSASEKAKALRQKKVRNLLLTNAAYKDATIYTFAITKKYTKKLLQKVDQELNKP